MGTYFKKLVGERVYLSPPDPSDGAIYATWLADLEVTKYTTASALVLGLEAEKDFLAGMAKTNHDFAIVERATDRPLGACGFLGFDSTQRRAEVGIFIGEKDFWSRGYGTEALSLLLDFGFNVKNFHNLLLRVKAFNTRAIRCYQKLGFKTIGVRREACLNGETYTDEIYMDLLAGEFQGRI